MVFNLNVPTASKIGQLLEQNPMLAKIALAGGLVASGVGAVAVGRRVSKRRVKKKSKKTTKKTTKRRTTRGISRDRKFLSKQKHEQAYKSKRKKPYKVYKRTTKKKVGKIYYTKKGQPYKILSSGKAKFIKKTKRRSK